MKRLKLLLSALLMLTFSSSVLAENNQTMVLGGGVGPYGFSDHDDTRMENKTMADVTSGGCFRLYSEWYIFGSFGIGLLGNYISAQRNYSSINGNIDHQWIMKHYFGTINIIPFGGESYARLGLYVGGGPSEYSLREEVWGTAADYDETVIVNGTAATFGIYGDWGGELFGMRAGFQYIESNYPDMEVNNRTYQISSSGGTLHFDLRWAF